MKKSSLLLVMLIVCSIASACPVPTTHGVIEIGCKYDYRGVWGSDNIGIGGRIGVEEPYRYITIYGVGSYAFGNKNWSAGCDVYINPLGVHHGCDTPINFALIAGGGYKSYVIDGWYGRIGLELSGRMGKVFSPYVSCTCDFNGGETSPSANMEIGLRFWIGQEW